MGKTHLQVADSQLLSAAIAGDTQAIEKLIAAHHNLLVAMIERQFPAKLRGWLEPSDILQDTYAAAFRTIRTFKPVGRQPFYCWLATIARSRIQDQLRAAESFKRQRRRLEARDRAMSDLLNRFAVYERTPSQSAAGRELLLAVKESIESLPSHYQKIIQLRHIQQLTPPEAAEQMDKSVGAAQMIYLRAIRLLREKLGSISLYV